MDNSENATDYTKTKTYASMDLTAKIISSAALVALGIAGWVFQVQTERSRTATEALDRQERKYLPMLRSLSLLELELESGIKNSYYSDADESPGQSLYNAGTELRFVAESVFVPDGDPVVWLRPPDTITKRGEGHQRIQMPLRASAIMYGELMRLKFFFQDARDDRGLSVDPQKRFLLITRESDDPNPGHLYVAPDSYPAWQAWLGDRTIKLSTVRGFSFNLLKQDLRFAASGVIQDVLNSHVDLGDRYVQIRDEVEKRKPYSENGSTQQAAPSP